MKQITAERTMHERSDSERRDTALDAAVAMLESIGGRVVGCCPSPECAVCRPSFELAA